MTTFNRAIEASVNCVSYGWAEEAWYFIVHPTDLDLGFVDPLCLKTG
ncbi:unnamed protein product, partial [marine sediment metagenome]